MKKIKRLLVLAMSLCMTVGLVILPVSAAELNTLIEENEITKIYKNNVTGEMYANIDLSLFDNTDKIIVYTDEATGNEVGIDLVNFVPDKNTRAEYTDGWSGGTLPNGISTLKPHASYGTYMTMSASFYADVRGNYPAEILRVYSPSYSCDLLTLNESNLSVLTYQSTEYLSALAELNFSVSFVQFGVVLQSASGFLRLEINRVGQVKLTWKW